MASKRGFGIAAAVPAEVVRAAAGLAESLGYDSFWVNDTPNGDGLAALAQAATVTTRIKLGVGVIPLSRRTAADIANQITDLNRSEQAHEGDTGEVVVAQGEPERLTGLSLPLDRLLLGVGSGAGNHPLGRVRAGVRDLKEALDTQVFIAALGPQMCRLGGAVADGVLLNWLTPDFTRTSAGWVAEGAQKAGRDTPTVSAYIRVALGEPAGRRLEQEANRYTSVPAYGAHFERQGVPAVETAVRADSPEAIQQALQAWDGLLDEIVVRAITANDSIDETLALVQAAAPAF